MVLTIGKIYLMGILIAIVLMGIAVIYFIRYPIKTLKFIIAAIAVIVMGVLAWGLLFAGLFALTN